MAELPCTWQLLTEGQNAPGFWSTWPKSTNPPWTGKSSQTSLTGHVDMKEPKHFTSSSTGGETLHATRHTDSATIKLKTSSRNHLGKSRTNRFHSPLPFKMWRLSQLKRSNALKRFKILERLNNKSPTYYKLFPEKRCLFMKIRFDMVCSTTGRDISSNFVQHE